MRASEKLALVWSRSWKKPMQMQVRPEMCSAWLQYWATVPELLQMRHAETSQSIRAGH